MTDTQEKTKENPVGNAQIRLLFLIALFLSSADGSFAGLNKQLRARGTVTSFDQKNVTIRNQKGLELTVPKSRIVAGGNLRPGQEILVNLADLKPKWKKKKTGLSK